MQIVLATSPHVRHPSVLQSDFAPDQSVMYSFAPVGLLALAAILRQELDLTPVLFDTNLEIVTGTIPLDAEFYRCTAARICAHEPDVLGFMTECDSYHHVLQMLAEVKRLRPDCRCILGGPHASAVARPTMERHAFVDAIVIGEGELSFPDLLRAFDDDDDRAVEGTLRRLSDGRLIEGGPRALVSSLDDLPIPAYDLYAGSPEEEIFIEAGRGCPFQCTFCSTAPFWRRKHRVKSPERILAEIRLVQQLYGARRVHFTHDLLTTDKHWVRALSRTLRDAGTPVKWTCSARTDTVDRELLEEMAAGGCNAIYFGIESGSNRLLRDIKKDVPIEESLEILHLCREVGITPNAGFIVGFPTEDRQSLRETFDAFERAFVMGTRPTYIFGFCPFAASTMYPTLDTLACDGHFLDIPIDAGLDAANRALVASDSDLFGAYYRPRIDVSPTRLQGVDEFSCLVETVAVPALALSRAVGGMLELFDRWTLWIERRNIAAGVAPHRRFYGGPLEFCDFLLDELRVAAPEQAAVLELADVIRTSFAIARTWSSGVGRSWFSAPPTSMATFRSIERPDVERPLQIGDELRLNAIVATKRLDYDVIAWLSARPDALPPAERRPTCLMWDLAPDRRVRLSQVDPFLHAALEQLQTGPRPVAALMLDWATAGEVVDYGRMMQVLSEARALHILETVPDIAPDGEPAVA